MLDDLSVAYDDAADLLKLYRPTLEALNIAPSQHTGAVFKHILGGCTSVVEGLAALRNRSVTRTTVGPSARHAQVAVNLSDSMTSFLAATWEVRRERGTAGANNRLTEYGCADARLHILQWYAFILVHQDATIVVM